VLGSNRAQRKVGHLWFVDPANRTLDVLELEGKRYRVVQTAADAKRGKFPPFTHAIDVAKLWQR